MSDYIIPEHNKILRNVFENIQQGFIRWNSDIIDPNDYCSNLVVINWICIYEQQLASAIMQGKEVVLE